MSSSGTAFSTVVPSSPAPTSAGGGSGGAAAGQEQQQSSSGNGLDSDDWTLALVLGVTAGVVLLGGCWCLCYFLRKRHRKRRDEKRKPSAAAAVADEEAPAEPISDLTQEGAGGASVASAPSSGLDGPLSAAPMTSTALTDNQAGPTGTNLQQSSGNCVSNTTTTVEWKTTSALSASASTSGLTPSPQATALATRKRAAAAAAAARKKQSVELTAMRDVSSFASPENYGEFPQPFSSLDVPVVPYGRSNSRSSAGGLSFVGSEEDGDEQHQQHQQQQDGGGAFLSNGREGE
ncbi:unnamed protein product, partial [Pylaiella littoralis]